MAEPPSPNAPRALPSDVSLRRFRELLTLPPAELPLFSTALLIAAIDRPDREGWWRVWEARFAQLVLQIRDDLAPQMGQGEEALVSAWTAYFAQTMGFRGAVSNYHAPCHSSLSHCIDQRIGLPITLAVLFVELGRSALGLRLFGVGTPGHFLAGGLTESGPVYMDPFGAKGRVLSPTEAARLVGSYTNSLPEIILPFLGPAAPRDILQRMLNNLRNAFGQHGSLDQLVTTLNWILTLDPHATGAQRDRGLALLRLGRLQEGAQDLIVYLRINPQAEDSDEIRQEVLRARSIRHSLN